MCHLLPLLLWLMVCLSGRVPFVRLYYFWLSFVSTFAQSDCLSSRAIPLCCCLGVEGLKHFGFSLSSLWKLASHHQLDSLVCGLGTDLLLPEWPFGPCVAGGLNPADSALLACASQF